uniref:Uncharacterized protein n=1 Tax=Arundo donax TaxID=35708 RepID=A0A0A9DHT7_ARUDO
MPRPSPRGCSSSSLAPRRR